MQCPKCEKEMNLERSDTSHNFDTNEKYDRKVFKCEVDNIWITIETPKK